MKPFLILQLRPVDKAADGEFEAFLEFSGLKENEVHRIRMTKEGVPKLDLTKYSAIIVGGGPSDISNAPEDKSPEQKRFELELQPLLDYVIKNDFPFLGACYGLGAMAEHKGGIVSKEKYTEPVSAVTIELTEEGKKDDLTKGLPKQFYAFVGHKEACQNVPEDAVLLASSEQCPVHMLRFKNNVYATQFHPELDVEGICLRIDIYKNKGYFPPEDAEELKEECRRQEVTVPQIILKRFVEKYRK